MPCGFCPFQDALQPHGVAQRPFIVKHLKRAEHPARQEGQVWKHRGQRGMSLGGAGEEEVRQPQEGAILAGKGVADATLRIQVHQQYLVTQLRQGYRQVEGSGRLAHTALGTGNADPPDHQHLLQSQMNSAIWP